MTKVKKVVSLLLSIVLLASVGILSAQAVSTSSKKTAESSTGIIIHYKSSTAPFVYFWNSLPKNIETAYPGAPMSRDTAEGENWYTYKFSNVTKINLLFTDKNGKQLSGELTRNTGEWWYNGKTWRSSNPDKTDPVSSVDFREESIYFVMTTRFYDGDESNDVHCWDYQVANNPDTDKEWRGDFKGLAEKLDYIKALGFSAIWVTPIVENASGYDYHGYHAIDFSKPDPRYESSDFTYQDLIDAVHAKGMKIIQDVVLQHTGNFGENYFSQLFTKDYTKDLSSLEDSMVPTQQLLDAAGVDTAEEYWNLKPQAQYDARLNLMKNVTYSGSNGNSTGSLPSSTDYDMNKVSTDSKYNSNNYYHTGYFQSLNWDDWTCKFCQIAGDCVDLNTENPATASYLVDCYSNYIDMGVDSFRVDTVRHIPRLVLNLMFNQQLMDAAKDSGNANFYMYGEICTRYTQIWYRGHAEESTPYYTWQESNYDKWANKWNFNDSSAEAVNENMNTVFDHYLEEDDTSDEPTSDNASLSGITYHDPDTSMASGMNAIDFQMHRMFGSASNAFNFATSTDQYYNDATYNVMYVDSHDYAPEQPDEKTRFTGGTQTWAEDLDLMFTFRGIPCIYYGSEIEFQKGAKIDEGTNISLANSGRAYYGDNLEGTVSASDFSEYTASGTVADTLSSPLSKHLQKINAIRRAVPALQKGQYTTNSNYVSGSGMNYIRRYTDSDSGVDSLALVTISGNGTFKNIPNGTYIDAVTGDVQNVSNGTLTATASGQANMRVYVCCSSGFTGISGKIGGDSSFLK